MELSFDYYHNLEYVDLFLCNPDGRELFPIVGVNRNVSLKFNDISSFTFDYYSTSNDINGNIVKLKAYEYVTTKRLVFVSKIGWFQITDVKEKDDGITKFKSVACESLQSTLKNKGFLSEERVYSFFDENDLRDSKYNASDAGSLPSVVGQLYQQAGIQINLQQGLNQPLTPYTEWTITYINNNLKYNGSTGNCRSFKDNSTTVYEWVVNEVEEAFGCVILFDFLYKTIHVMLPDEVTEKSSVIFTFDNFMKEVEIEEKSEDIVTVLSCNGENCDIRGVNPTGTNYICDFSYYMDTRTKRWMSDALINKLNNWKQKVETERPGYTQKVALLRSIALDLTKEEAELKEASTHANSLNTAVGQYYESKAYEENDLFGDVVVETVLIGHKSIDINSTYKTTTFTGNSVITAYSEQPTYDNGVWTFSGPHKTGTVDSLCTVDISLINDQPLPQYLYFSDGNTTTYCMLQPQALLKTKGRSVFANLPAPSVNNIGEAYYVTDSFVTNNLFIEGPGITVQSGHVVAIVAEGDSYKYTYTDVVLFKCLSFKKHISFNGIHNNVPDIVTWHNLQEKNVNSIRSIISTGNSRFEQINKELESITSQTNIISYFANTPSLLKELNCYWIEGEYTNNNISVTNNTSIEDEIDLENELLISGEAELEKISQPKYSFSLSAIDMTKQYEFRNQMKDIILGKVITIEKEEGLWYYPALLQMDFSLDNTDNFSLSFANKLRLDDWGYTYADLISSSSSTSKQVASNWQNLTSYSKDRDTISALIKQPLSASLRATFSEAVEQEFSVTDAGILGRKKALDESGFNPEQIRLVNNQIIFTDDGWKTAKAAFGKITYVNPDTGRPETAYGLIGETIIGSLLLGQRIKIKNSDNSVSIDENGIKILDANGNVLFEAGRNNPLVVNGYATSDIAVSNVSVYYGLSSSPTVPPVDSEWSTEAPAWEAGKYMWQKTVWVYANGGIDESPPTCLTGAKGEDGKSISILGSYSSLAELQAEHPTGNQGDGYLVQGDLYVWNGSAWENVGRIQGPEGEQGRGVQSIVTQYYNSTRIDTPAGGSWSTAQPEWQPDKYIWIRSHITWTGGTTSNTTPVLSNTLNSFGTKLEMNKNKIALVVDDNNLIKSASIVAAINQQTGQSSVKLQADTIDINGLARFFVEPGDLGENGTTIIDGGRIQTGQILISTIRSDAGRHVDTNENLPSIYDGDGNPDDNIINRYYCVDDETSVVNGVEQPGRWYKAAWNPLTSQYEWCGNDDYWTSVIFDANLSNRSTRISDFYTTGNSIYSGLPGSESVWNKNGFFLCSSGVAAKYEIAGHERRGWCIGVGGKFGVTIDGNMYAQNAYLQGEINANKGSIGGWNITGSMLKGGSGQHSIALHSSSSDGAIWAGQETPIGAPFVVKPTGELIARNGEIANWKISATEGIYQEWTNSSASWKMSLGNNNDKGIVLTGISGGQTISRTSLSDGGLYIENPQTTYKTQLLSSSIFFTGPINEFMLAMHYGEPSSSSAIMGVQDISVRRYAGAYVLFNHNATANKCVAKLMGSWESQSPISITSDKNKKHDIQTVDEPYSDLFDKLLPIKYKYNNDRENSFHLGFVAQDVENAIQEVGLCNNDFAALAKSENGYGLRYSEFIALNTWQIQKLKKKIQELELIIKKLDSN